MTIGVSGFVGERLRLARLLRQIDSQQALGEMLSVERQTVSRWETGLANPRLEFVSRLAETLNVPQQFFFKDIPDTHASVPFFRSQKAATAVQRNRAQALLVIMADIATQLETIVDLPIVDIPFRPTIKSFRSLTDEQIEEIGSAVRRNLGVKSGPMPNLLRLLEHRGVLIAKTPLAPKELDGASWWIGDRPYILLNEGKSAARSRMDLAHELGHLCLHSPLDELFLKDREAFKVIENQAFRFAGALLLPPDEFRHSLRTFRLDELLGIKVRFQVSLAMIIKRISDLEIMPDDEVLKLWKMRSRGRWNQVEPLEDAVKPEEPLVYRSAIDLIQTEVGYFPEEVREWSASPEIEFDLLTGLGGVGAIPKNVVSLFN